MAKAKSKEFFLKLIRDSSNWYQLCSLNGRPVTYFYYRLLTKHFGIDLKPSEKERIEITMKVVKGEK